jgi:hypothetical protein
MSSQSPNSVINGGVEKKSKSNLESKLEKRMAKKVKLINLLVSNLLSGLNKGLPLQFDDKTQTLHGTYKLDLSELNEILKKDGWIELSVEDSTLKQENTDSLSNEQENMQNSGDPEKKD